MLKMRMIVPVMIAIGWPCFTFGSPNQVSVLAGSDLENEAKTLSCKNVAPNEDSPVKLDFLKKWSVYVSMKTFSLSHDTIDNTLVVLQDCFTTSGWNQFNDALNKSGNLNLIKTNHLSSNTHLMGQVVVQPQKEQQTWTADIPIRVVYQNDKQKISQQIHVHLRFSQLPNNKLAVMQIVGLPTKENDVQTPTLPAS
jgi:hypothetical protein